LRIGRFGHPFMMLKFRTMVEGAEADGPAWSPPDDPRVTRLGRILRKYRLDELPQLVDVLRGDMSLVGPRPERPEMVTELEKKIPFYRERENVLPGITGWAQIQYPYGATAQDAQRKLEYDLYYINNLSFALDLQIILHTFRIVLLGLERSMS
jgi:lipopolysaccharide/colanic/teichoic acid biosynthesis glycosyltransferase